MFSKEFNVSEAIEVINEMDEVLFTESLSGDLSRMSGKLGIPLGYEHYRKTKDRIFDPSAINRLRDMLDPEYALLDAVIVNNAKF